MACKQGQKNILARIERGYIHTSNETVLQFRQVTMLAFWTTNFEAEIVKSTLVVSRFRFLRVRCQISVLRVIILPETQILKVGSRISDWSQFRFSFLTFYVAPSCITRPGATRNKKNVRYQPEKIQQRRYKPKLNKNNQYAMQCRENKSRFHYLCFEVE